MRFAWIAILAFATTVAAAAERAPSFPQRTPYADARESLLALGWTPLVTDKDPNRCSPGRDECETYPETVACSGTGRGFCSFRWRRKETIIEIGTYGEDPIVGSVRCRVNCR
jgi:hypothetical protein